jgi:AcrR family transcriptional regulator
MANGRPGPPDGRMRADGRRNYEQLLAVAGDTFAEQGTEASLREVARRAGVGIGTLYRHFPTREALLEAVLRQGFDTLRGRAAELLAAPEPGAALVTWLGELAAGATRYDGLPAEVIGALHDPGSRLHASCQGLRDAAAALLARAQGAGQIRPDLDAGELIALAGAVAWAAGQGPRPAAAARRYLSVLVNGLAAGPPG